MTAKHPTIERTHFTPRVLAEQTGLNVITILQKINSGQLKATNISTALRPRWIIAKADWQAYLDERSNQKPASRPTTRRVKTNKNYLAKP